MDPKTFLKTNKISVTTAAKELNCSRQWLSTLINRDDPWPLDKAKEFAEYTGGAVPIAELLRLV